jgi:metastasis-associated protein MTA
MLEWGEEGGLLSRQRWPHCKPTDSVSAVGGPPPSKRPHKDQSASLGPSYYPRHIPGRAVVNHLNGKTKIATMTRVGSGRKQVISWTDAPDDMYFRATDNTK